MMYKAFEWGVFFRMYTESEYHRSGAFIAWNTHCNSKKMRTMDRVPKMYLGIL